MIAWVRQGGLAALFVALVGWVWWLDSHLASDPTPDHAIETATARRARLQELLDREVTVQAVNEPLGDLILRLCRAARVPAKFVPGESEADGADTVTARIPLQLQRRVSLTLRYPVRLCSALAMVAPYARWNLVGDELWIGTRGSRQVSVHTYPFPFRRTLPLLNDLAHFDRQIGFEEPSVSPDDARLVCSVGEFLDDHLHDLLAALESAGAGRLSAPARIGETASDRAVREKIEAALARTVDVDSPSTFGQAIASFEEQLDVNLHLDWRSIALEGVNAETPVSVEPLPAGSALRHLLRPLNLEPVLGHDVVSIDTPFTSQSSISLRVYPTNHLARRDWTPDDLLEFFFSAVSPRYWNAEVGGVGGDLQCIDRDAVIIFQSEPGHQELEQAGELLGKAVDPAQRLAAGTPREKRPLQPWQLKLQRPALPLSGPLTLDELVRRVAAQADGVVVLDDRGADWGETVSVRHRRYVSPSRGLLLPGDAGEGTLDQQLGRLLYPAGWDAILQDDALVILPESLAVLQGSPRGLHLDFHPLPRFADIGPLDHGVVAVNRRGMRYIAGVEGLTPAARIAWNLRKPTWPVLPGIFDRLLRAEHDALRRALTPGHPVSDFVGPYVHETRAGRIRLLASALEGGNSELADLAIWLMESDMLATLRPALWSVFRSGMLLTHNCPQASSQVWNWIVEHHPPEELAAALRVIAAQPGSESDRLSQMAVAAAHPHTAVRRAALEGIAALAERGCFEASLDVLKAHLPDPGLHREAHAALALYVEHWGRQLGEASRSEDAFRCLLAVHSRSSAARELIQFELVERGSKEWTDIAYKHEEILLAMLDDDQAEQRRLACGVLGLLGSPSTEVVSRVERAAFDPPVSDVARAALERWRQVAANKVGFEGLLEGP